MEIVFHDISKYYAARIVDNLLTIGKIVQHEDNYIFSKDTAHGPFNLDDGSGKDIQSLINVIGEIHPDNALRGILTMRIGSCLYLNENNTSGEIEVRSIHKGMGTSIYSNQECPLIMWNPNYSDDRYFDVIDIQHVFSNARLKDSFTAIISESLRALELFPPLMNLKK